jgi:cell division protein FtsB
MTDIVEDLRLLQSGATWVCGETAATLEDAADEIERLRAALKKIAARVDRLTGGLTYTEKAARDIARAALGEGTP